MVNAMWAQMTGMMVGVQIVKVMLMKFQMEMRSLLELGYRLSSRQKF